MYLVKIFAEAVPSSVKGSVVKNSDRFPNNQIMFISMELFKDCLTIMMNSAIFLQ